MKRSVAGASKITSWTAFDAITPPSGRYALVTPFANVTMSGATPQCPSANIRPVRPNPVMISSAMNSTLCLSQILRIAGKYRGRRNDAAAP